MCHPRIGSAFLQLTLAPQRGGGIVTENCSTLVGFLNCNQGVFSVLFSFLVAVSTVAYAILTRSLVTETKRLREVETEPLVVAYLALSQPWEPMFDFVVRNIGKGAAHDVRWDVAADEAELAQFGVFPEWRSPRKLSFLAPEQELRFHFGSTFSVVKDPPNTPMRPLKVVVFYSNDRATVRSSEFVLEPQQFYKVAFASQPKEKEIAAALKEISRALQKAH